MGNKSFACALDSRTAPSFFFSLRHSSPRFFLYCLAASRALRSATEVNADGELGRLIRFPYSNLFFVKLKASMSGNKPVRFDPLC